MGMRGWDYDEALAVDVLEGAGAAAGGDEGLPLLPHLADAAGGAEAGRGAQRALRAHLQKSFILPTSGSS